MIPRTELLAMRRIASKINPRIKDWAGLADKAERRRLGLTLAEGRLLAREGLNRANGSGFPPKALIVSDQGAGHPEAGALLKAARVLGIECFSLSDPCYRKITGHNSPEGLALVCAAPDPSAPNTLSPASGGVWLIADGVQDPGNAGSLVRTALAAGATGCLFLGGADPSSPKFLRGSMGAAFSLPCLSWTMDEFMAQRPAIPLRLIVAATDPGARDYREITRDPPSGIVIGGEKGVSPEMLAIADEQAHIPLDGGVESLNLSVAAGILLFEYRSGRHP